MIDVQTITVPVDMTSTKYLRRTVSKKRRRSNVEFFTIKIYPRQVRTWLMLDTKLQLTPPAQRRAVVANSTASTVDTWCTFTAT
jgi:hypothetical protein